MGDEFGGIELPSCLERVDGEIRIAGHRVSLFRVIDEIREGEFPCIFPEVFPTVPARTLAEVVTFIAGHRDAARDYHARRCREFAAIAARIEKGPSMEELRRRKAERTG